MSNYMHAEGKKYAPKPNPNHQKYYQGMYNKECLKNEELQAKCNIFAGIALTCLIICVMMLIVVGVVLFG